MSRCEKSYQHIVDTTQKCETRTTNGDRFTEDSDSMRVIEMLLNSEIAIARKGPKPTKLAQANIWFKFISLECKPLQSPIATG